MVPTNLQAVTVVGMLGELYWCGAAVPMLCAMLAGSCRCLLGAAVVN